MDKARTREYGGSGIGLSIVKAIMESFHRECGVLNHEDGVEFWFELDTEKTGIGSGQAEKKKDRRNLMSDRYAFADRMWNESI